MIPGVPARPRQVDPAVMPRRDQIEPRRRRRHRREQYRETEPEGSVSHHDAPINVNVYALTGTR